jgi:hypothetical protein
MSVSLVSRFYRTRSKLRMKRRIAFPSPAEMRLLEIMGGRVWRINAIKDFHTGFPLTVVLSRGKLFRKEHVRREVRIGKYYADFANDVGRVIEVDGHAFHQNEIKEGERNDYLRDRGYRVKHIKAADIYRNPVTVREIVTEFLTH